MCASYRPGGRFSLLYVYERRSRRTHAQLFMGASTLKIYYTSYVSIWEVLGIIVLDLIICIILHAEELNFDIDAHMTT